MNDDQLDAWLADIAREDEGVTAPAHVETRTMAAWDEWRRDHVAVAPRSAGRRWAVGALAALAASGLVALALPRPGPTPPPVPTVVAPAVADGPDVRAIPNEAAADDTATRSPAVDGTVFPEARPAEAAAESMRFIPLGPDLEYGLPGSFQLVRVRVPRDVLVDLGVLIDGRRSREPVQADVVFGEDGLAKAIRLAPVSRRIP